MKILLACAIGLSVSILKNKIDDSKFVKAYEKIIMNTITKILKIFLICKVGG